MEGKDFNIDRDAGFITWMAGQPNNKNGNQFCTVFVNTNELNDVNSEELHAFVCYDGTNEWFLLFIPTFLQ